MEQISQLEGEKRPRRGRWEVWRCGLGKKQIMSAFEGGAMVTEKCERLEGAYRGMHKENTSPKATDYENERG